MTNYWQLNFEEVSKCRDWWFTIKQLLNFIIYVILQVASVTNGCTTKQINLKKHIVSTHKNRKYACYLLRLNKKEVYNIYHLFKCVNGHDIIYITKKNSIQ